MTIARLHNLGNYEHVRYEVTVEIPPGTSPASVARELENTLNALEPKAPESLWSVREATKLLAQPAPVLQPSNDDDPFDNPEAVLRRALDKRTRAVEILAEYDAWRKARDAALRRFDKLGGASQHTDAKDHWDEDQ